MRRSKHQTTCTLCVLLVLPSAAALACGYGLGNREFGRQRGTAVAFARALQAGDTARMRSLSAPEAGKKVATLTRDIPRAYRAFARTAPDVITQEGGGIYGGTFGAVFLAVSTPLQSCNGGVQIHVATLTGHPQVITVRPVPSPDSLTDDACRRAIRGE